ncbi:MAG: hypothetical protein QM820_53545 [Minicystis sp.]
MRKLNATLFGLLLGAGSVIAGCNGSAESPSGSSQARLVMAVQGTGSASLHVTASDQASAEVVIDRVVTVKAGEATVIDLDVAPSSYAFHVDVMGGASGAHLGDGSAEAVIAGGATTEIRMTAIVADSGGDGSAKVQVGVDTAPQIQGIAVEADGSAGGDAKIHVDAVDADGDALTFFWSGAGLEGAVQGSATLSVSAAALASASAPVIHVVVQDKLGATTAADITLVPSGSGFQGSIDASGGAGAAIAACLEGQAACTAACDASFGVDLGAVTGHASCIADCGLSLASCQAQ